MNFLQGPIYVFGLYFGDSIDDDDDENRMEADLEDE